MEGTSMNPEKSTEAWIRDLSDERAPTRCTAVYELGRIGDGRAVEHLVSALTDTYLSVRQYAAESLGILGNREAIGPLVKALEDDDLTSRAIIANALTKITSRFFSTPDEWSHWYWKAYSPVARP
jgi:HEAT repeat protein